MVAPLVARRDRLITIYFEGVAQPPPEDDAAAVPDPNPVEGWSADSFVLHSDGWLLNAEHSNSFSASGDLVVSDSETSLSLITIVGDP